MVGNVLYQRIILIQRNGITIIYPTHFTYLELLYRGKKFYKIIENSYFLMLQSQCQDSLICNFFFSMCLRSVCSSTFYSRLDFPSDLPVPGFTTWGSPPMFHARGILIPASDSRCSALPWSMSHSVRLAGYMCA